MTRLFFAFLILFAALAASPSTALSAQYGQQTKSDREILNKAVDYFQSGKYHEALIMFKKLDSRYRLNLRFKAYMSVCHYYDGEYKDCKAIVDSIADRLDVFAPHERSVYFYDAGESCFFLKKYQKAIDYFERVLLICYDNEKGDILMRLGQCYRRLLQIETAQEYFVSAKAYYERFNDEWKMRKFLETMDNDNGDTDNGE